MIERVDDGERFAPGTTVVLREVLDGRIRSARPLRVVADDADGLVGYLVPRSTVAWPRLLDGTQSQTPDQGWLLPEEEWFGPGSLYVVPAGAGYAAVLFFDRDTGEPLSWKVDFFRPPVRTSVGFDTLDHALDLLVALDRSSWRPKDLDDAAQLRRVAVLDEAELAALAAERATVEDLLGRRAAPFDDRWPAWRPDPTWPPLRLPAGWDHIDPPERDRARHAPAVRSASGIELLTAAGTRVIDLDLAGGTLPCGHAHPAIVEAVARQVPLGWGLGGGHPAVDRLAAVLCDAVAPLAGSAPVALRWYPSGIDAAAAAQVAAELTHAPDGDGPGRVVVDLRGRLLEGWPPVDIRARGPLPAGGGAAVVLGDDLFAGFGGGAVLWIGHDAGSDPSPEAGPMPVSIVVPDATAAPTAIAAPNAIAAVAALETLEQLCGDGPARAADAAAHIRAALGVPGGGAGFFLPAELVGAAAAAGVVVAPTGRATVATVVTAADVDTIVERLGPILAASRTAGTSAEPGPAS